jgi:hypothetical protein
MLKNPPKLWGDTVQSCQKFLSTHLIAAALFTRDRLLA